MHDSFAQWLKRQRHQRDLTQAELAERVGCSTVLIHKIETDERRPSRQIAERLLDVLDVPAAQQVDLLLLARAIRKESSVVIEPATVPALPVAPTRLIGRTAELATARTFFQRNEGSLLTITGPAGVGKTRFSLALAHDLAERFSGAVFFVPLAPVADPQLLASTIAQTLQLGTTVLEQPETRLVAALRQRSMLLILDNFEHLIGAAPVVATLLANCPGLRVLVTSRGRLQVRGEQVVALQPLALPNGSQHDDPLAVADAPAVALFVERVRALRPDFALTLANAPTVSTLCARLDGLPLAIELVAATSTLFSPQMLLNRLTLSANTPLHLPTAGAVDLPERHRTLHAAHDWSFDLLQPPLQRLFARLGVFVGTWTIAEAEGVAGTDWQAAGGWQGLRTLVESSLVHSEYAEPEARFRLLEITRSYALEQLERLGELAATWQRLALYYIQLTETAGNDIDRIDQESWLAHINAQRDNIRAALRWCQHHNPTLGLRLAAGLWWFWFLRGALREGEEALASLQAAVGSQASPNLVAEANTGAAALAWARDDYAGAARLASLAAEQWQALGNNRGLGYALLFLGKAHYRHRDANMAQTTLEQAVTLFEAVGDRWGLAYALYGLRQVHTFTGAYERAWEVQQQSVTLWRALGDRWGLGLGLNGLGELLRLQGDDAGAAHYYAESLELFRAIDDQSNSALVRHNLAHALLQTGQVAAAAQQFHQALQFDRAHLEEERIFWHIAGLAAVAAAQANWDIAVQLCACVQCWQEQGSTLFDTTDRLAFERTVALLQGNVPPEQWQYLWARGKALITESAVALALSIA